MNTRMKQLGKKLEKLAIGMVAILGVLFMDYTQNNGELIQMTSSIFTRFTHAATQEVEPIDPMEEWVKGLSRKEAKAELEKAWEAYNILKEEMNHQPSEAIQTQLKEVEQKITALSERATRLRIEFAK